MYTKKEPDVEARNHFISHLDLAAVRLDKPLGAASQRQPRSVRWVANKVAAAVANPRSKN
jgi:hypothetical protein